MSKSAYSHIRKTKMIISDLNKMEEIVNKNSNLSWDGWNVIHLSKSNSAMYKQNGAFVNNTWNIKTVYEPGKNGWNIKSSHLE